MNSLETSKERIKRRAEEVETGCYRIKKDTPNLFEVCASIPLLDKKEDIEALKLSAYDFYSKNKDNLDFDDKYPCQIRKMLPADYDRINVIGYYYVNKFDCSKTDGDFINFEPCGVFYFKDLTGEIPDA